MLYHNNYIIVGEKERHFTGGYHEQKYQGKKNNVHNAINAICRYSWENHIEVLKTQFASETEMKAEDCSFKEQIDEMSIQSGKTIVLEVLKDMQEEFDKKTEKGSSKTRKSTWFEKLVACLKRNQKDKQRDI